MKNKMKNTLYEFARFVMLLTGIQQAVTNSLLGVLGVLVAYLFLLIINQIGDTNE